MISKRDGLLFIDVELKDVENFDGRLRVLQSFK